MKIRTLLIAFLLLSPILGFCQTSNLGAVREAYSRGDSGANYQVWQSKESRYIQLQPGMNYFHNGQWLPSQSSISPQSSGGAAAVQGQHRVYFPENVYNEPVTFITPLDEELQISPDGISYYDGTNFAVISAVTNSTGEILETGNQVLYPNAYMNIGADLLCTYKEASYESDVVFHQRPPSPDQFGINPSNAWLQVWTEFYVTNEPTISFDPKANTNDADPYLEFSGMKIVHGRAFILAGTNSLDDGSGFPVRKRWVQDGTRRFLVEEVPYLWIVSALQSLPAAQGAVAEALPPKRSSRMAWSLPRRARLCQTNVMQMAKAISNPKCEFVLDYLMMNSSSFNNYTFHGDSTYLISGAVNLTGNSNVFEGGAVIKFTNTGTIWIQPSASVQWQTSAYQPVVFTSMSDNSIGQAIPGSTGSPMTMTNVYLFNMNWTAGMQVENVRFKYAGIGIQSFTWLALSDSQFLDCGQGLRPMAYFDINGTVSSGSAGSGYLFPYWGVALFNDLFAGCGTAVSLDDGATFNYITAYPAQGVDLYLTAQNVTVDGTTNFVKMAAPTYSTGCGGGCGGCGGVSVEYAYGSGGYSVDSIGFNCTGETYYPTHISSYSQTLLTNCLFTATNQNIETVLLNTIGSGWGTRGYNTNIIYPYVTPYYGCGFGDGNVIQLGSAGSPYQPVGAGYYYLSPSSGYNNIGSFAVQSNLLSDLQQKTTEAPNPWYTSNTWSSANYVLQPYVQRNTNALPIGYSYAPIDYLISDLYLTNTVVLITNGTVIAFGNDAGITVEGGSTLVSQGAPQARNYFVHYSSVQEQTANWGSAAIPSAEAIAFYHPDDNTPPTAEMRLSTIVSANGATNVVYEPGGVYNAGSFSLQDCEIFGVGGNFILSTPSDEMVTLDNNLFKYCNAYVDGDGEVVAWNNLFTAAYSNRIYQVYFTNNGTATWTNLDSAFDNVTVNLTGVGVCSNSAYLNETFVESAKQPTDITTNLAWVAGPLGNYYQASNSPLINGGSRTANLAGLYQYTVMTNLIDGMEIKETNSIVDIGYHYVAGNQYGNPLETGVDSLPDYIANPDGTEPTRLGYWRFNNAPYWSDELGLAPLIASGLTPIPSWSGDAVEINSQLGSVLAYPGIRTNGAPVLTMPVGTIRFWFKPDWNSKDNNGNSGPGSTLRLFEVGEQSTNASYGWFALTVDPLGSTLTLSTEANGIHTDNAVCPIAFNSGDWYQIAVTYSSTNSCIYVNGQYVISWADPTNGIFLYTNGFSATAAGSGIANVPSEAVLQAGFYFGCSWDGNYQANGRFDELETFNDQLSSSNIAADYEAIMSIDTNGDGVPDVTKNALGLRTDTADSDCDGLPDAWKIAHGLSLSDPSDVTMEIYQAYAGGGFIPAQNQVLTVQQTNLINIGFVTSAASMAGQSVSGGVVASSQGSDTWNYCDGQSDYIHGIPLVDAGGNSLNAKLYAYVGPCLNYFVLPPPWDMGWDVYQFSAPDYCSYLYGINGFIDPMGWYGDYGWNVYGDWFDSYVENYVGPCGVSPTNEVPAFQTYFRTYWWQAYYQCCLNGYDLFGLYYNRYDDGGYDFWAPTGPFFLLPYSSQAGIVQMFLDSTAYARNLAGYIGVSAPPYSAMGSFNPYGCAECFVPPFASVEHSTNWLGGNDGAAWRWYLKDPIKDDRFGVGVLYTEAQRTLLISGLTNGEYTVNVYYDCAVPVAAANITSGGPFPSDPFTPITSSFNFTTATCLTTSSGTKYWHALVNTVSATPPSEESGYVGSSMLPWALTNGGGLIAITMEDSPANQAAASLKILGIQIISQQLGTNDSQSPSLQARPVAEGAYLAWQPAGSDNVYDVYRAVGSTNNTWTLVSTVTNTFSFQDAGLTAGQSYYYKVAGVEGNGTVDLSSPPICVVPYECPPPLPPRLDYVLPLQVIPSGNTYALSAQLLLTNSDAYDPQGLPLEFVVDSLANGSLLINGQPYSSVNCTFGVDDSVVWTAPPVMQGTNLTAFYVHVFDGINASSNSVPLQIQQEPPVHLFGWGENACGKVGNGYYPGEDDIQVGQYPDYMDADPLACQATLGIWNLDPRWGYMPYCIHELDFIPQNAEVSPVLVMDGDNISDISSSDCISAGIGSEGQLRVWGDAHQDCLFGRPIVWDGGLYNDLITYSWKDSRVSNGGYQFAPLAIPSPVEYPGPLTNKVISVAALDFALFVITDDGRLWSWGLGSDWLGRNPANGAFGYPDSAWGETGVYPELVFNDNSQVVEVHGDSAGYNGDQGVICRKADGTVWWWGVLYGEYGNYVTKDYYLTGASGDGLDHSQPMEVTSLNISGAAPIIQMSANSEHYVFLRADGSVSEMGYLASKEAGSTWWWWWGPTVSDEASLDACFANSPTNVVGLPTNICQVAASKGFGVALTTDGNVWIWGVAPDLDSPDFDLVSGDFDRSTNTAPRQIIGLKNITKIAASSYGAVFAVDTDGYVWGWGYGYDAIFGDTTLPYESSFYYQLVPKRVPGLEKVENIYVSSGYDPSAFALGAATTGVPDGLSASPMDSQVQLSWNSYSNATYYIIYRSLNENSGYVAIGNAAQNTFLDAGPLQDGQTYYYEVSAVVNGNETPRSWDVGATPFPAPGQVQNLSSALTCHGVLLQWQAPSNAASSPIQSYLVSADGTNLATLPAYTTNYYDPNGVSGEDYTVSAYNSAGQATNQITANGSDTIPCAPAPVVSDSTWLTDQTNGADDLLDLQWSGPDPSSSNIDWHFQLYEFPDDGFINRLSNQSDPLSVWLWGQFDTSQQAEMLNTALPMATRLSTLTNVLNVLLDTPQSGGVNGSIYTANMFQGITLRPQTTSLLNAANPPTGMALTQLNRMLLDDYYGTVNPPLFTRGPNWGSQLTGFVIHYRTLVTEGAETLDHQWEADLSLSEVKYTNDTTSNPYWGLYQYTWLVPQGAKCWASVSAVVDNVEGDQSTQLGPVVSSIPNDVLGTWGSTVRAIPGYKQVYLDWQDEDYIYDWDVYFCTNLSAQQWAPVPGGIDLQINRCWHTGLLVGTNYSYQVVANLTDGSQIDAPVVTVTVTNSPAPVVTNFAAKASAFDGMVLVEWDVPKTNLTDPDVITQTNWQFFVERKPANLSDDNYQLLTTAGFGLTFMDSTVQNGNSYTYRVTAFDSSFNRLQALAGLNGGTDIQITPTATNGLTLLPPQPGNGYVDLTWSPIRATQYMVERSLNSSGPFSEVATLNAPDAFDNAKNTCRDKGLQNGVTYYYQVTAVTPAGNAVVSDVQSATPLASLAPLPPDNFQGVVQPIEKTNTVLLTWNAQSGAASYQVFLQNQTTLTPISAGPFTSCAYPVPENIAPNAVMVFAVRSVNSQGLAGDLTETTVTNQPIVNNTVNTTDPVILFVGGSPTPLTVTGPTNLTLSADVSLPGVSQVSFYSDGQLIGTANSAPYQITWFHVPGSGAVPHHLTAVAFQQSQNISGFLSGGGNATYTSPEVDLTVNVEPEFAAYQTSATDLQLPAPGFPIVLSRSYSSRSTEPNGILGIGWSADWSLGSVKLSATLDSGWYGITQSGSDGSIYCYIGDSVGHNVTVTLPGGQSVEFAPQLQYETTTVDGYPSVEFDGVYGISFQPFAPNSGTLSANLPFPASISVTSPTSDDYETWNEDLVMLDVGNLPQISYTAPDGTTYQFGQPVGDNLTWLLTQITDRSGNSLNYSYDSNNNLLSISNSCGRGVTFDYSVQNNVTNISVYDSIGGAPVIVYAVSNNLLTQVLQFVNRANPVLYQTNCYAYGTSDEDLNRLTDIYDARGIRTLHNVYTNSNGDLALQICPEQTNDYTFDTSTYDLTVSAVTSTATNTTMVASDTSGATSSVTQPASGTSPSSVNATQCGYDSQGNLVSQTDANGNTKTYSYDSENRLVGQSDGDGNSTSVSLNQFGQTAISTDANGNQTRYSYDAGGNPVSVQDPSGTTTSSSYSTPVKDGNGNPLLGELLLSQSQSVPFVPYTIVTLNSYATSGTITGDLLQTIQEWQDNGGNVIGTPVATSYTYDANGNRLTQVTSRTVNGGAQFITNSYTYDAQNRVIMTVTSAGGSEMLAPQTNSVTYNELGKQATSTDAAGRTTTNVYDFNGNLIETEYPDGTVSRTAYDGFGDTIYTQDRAVPDPNGTTTASATYNIYDASKRVIQTGRSDNVQLTKLPAVAGTDFFGMNNNQYKMVVASAGTVLTTNLTFYDAVGNVQYSVNDRGAVTQNQYDAAGRLTNTLVYTAYTFFQTGGQVPSPTAPYQSTSYTYDPNGNQLTVTDAAGHTTRSIYDDADQLTEVDEPAANGGTVSKHTYYDGLGRKIEETDEAGVSKAYTYDFRGLLTSVTLDYGTAQAATTVYQYDEAGNEIAQTDAAGRTTTFQYDALGRRTGRTLPGGQNEGFVYDLEGNQIYHTNFNGMVITNQYDMDNRLTNCSSVAYNASYAYSDIGLRTNMADASGATAYFYNELSELTNKTVAWNNGPTVSLYYGYDLTGTITNIESSSANGVNLTYQYDILGRITNVLADGNPIANYGYDIVGNLQAVQYGNGVTNLYQYDAMNRLTNQVSGTASASLASFAYVLGPTGNRLSLSENVNGAGRNYGWNYDSFYRLTNEVIGGATVGNVGYAYDLVGNRTERNSTIPGLANQAPIYDPNDRMTNSDVYDPDGNTTNSSGNSYQYDALDHLTNVNSGQIVMTYDGDGNRVTKTVGGITTYYLLDDANPSGYSQILEEWTSTGTPTLSKVYNYGSDLISQVQPNVSTNYFIFDGHGSTRMLTDNGANIVNAFAYDAFGNLIASNTSPETAYLYCCQQWDSDLGFYLNRARYLNPTTGRFWTMDTYDGDNEDPLSLHKYLYAADDSVNLDDPSGNDYGDFDINISSIHKELIQVEQAYNFDSPDSGFLSDEVLAATTVAKRSWDYGLDDYLINETLGAIHCRWFRAAQAVTAWNGVGAAERWYSVGTLSGATADYLTTCNQYLYVWNEANFIDLDDGTDVPGLVGLRGKNLDYALVASEQHHVQGFTKNYFPAGSKTEKKAFAQIDKATYSPNAPTAVKAALKARFADKGKTYHFEVLNDRITLGDGVIDWVYQNTVPQPPN